MKLIESILRAKSAVFNSSLPDCGEAKSPLVVLDVGCRWGFAEKFIAPRFHQLLKIYGFDPDEGECRRLQSAYSHLPSGFVNCIPMALAEFTGRRNLYVTKEPACSSLHPPIKHLSDRYQALKCIELEKVVTVNVTSLEQWASENNLASMDYIKIDTQGSELEILKGAAHFLQTTRCIDIEVEFNPIYAGQSLFAETDAYLRSRGFVLWRLSNLVHYSNSDELIELSDSNTICFDDKVRQEMKAFGGQLYWADARYVNSGVLLADGGLNRAQLERDLILFDALGMSDLVHSLNKIRANR